MVNAMKVVKFTQRLTEALTKLKTVAAEQWHMEDKLNENVKLEAISEREFKHHVKLEGQVKKMQTAAIIKIKFSVCNK